MYIATPCNIGHWNKMCLTSAPKNVMMAQIGEMNNFVFFQGMASGSPKVQQLVVAGPSGSGKSTLLKKLFEEFPEEFGFSVSRKCALQT